MGKRKLVKGSTPCIGQLFGKMEESNALRKAEDEAEEAENVAKA